MAKANKKLVNDASPEVNNEEVKPEPVKTEEDTTKLLDGTTVDFEGAHRSPDNMSLAADKSDNVVETAEPKGNRYQKVFVVHVGSGWNGDDYAHDANKVATLQEALNNGAHPLEEATFDGQEDHPDGVSLILYYSVKVKPAEENPTSAETVAPGQSKHLEDPK